MSNLCLFSSASGWHGEALLTQQKRDARDLFALLIKGLAGTAAQPLLWDHFGSARVGAGGREQAAHMVAVPVSGFASLQDALANTKEAHTASTPTAEDAGTSDVAPDAEEATADGGNFDFCSVPGKVLVLHLKRFRWDSDAGAKAKVTTPPLT